MNMVCSQCGAPLLVTEGAQFARCQYCGVNVQLRAPEAKRTAHAPVQISIDIQKLAGPPRPSRLRGLIVLVSVLSILPAFIFPLALLGLSPGLASLFAAVTKSQFGGPVCLLDANGDGISDLLGLSGQKQASVVDGATGKLLWSGEAHKEPPQLACFDARWFAVVGTNFQAELHDARNLGAPVRVLLRDKLDAYATGTGCVRIRTSDGSIQDLALPGGRVVHCEPDAKLRPYHQRGPGMINLTAHSAEVRVGARAYSLDKRRQGTEILSVSVFEGHNPVWSRQLPYAAPTFDTAIATDGRSIALWAAEPNARDKAILVGLDAETGEQRYAVPAKLLVSNSLQYFGYNGRFIVVQAWTSLHAYHADSGELAWKIGP